MRALFVEDDRARMPVLLGQLRRGDTYVRSIDAMAGVHALRTDAFDVVFLDHDLGGNYNGQNVARYIVGMTFPPPVIVHSWNPVGAAAICKLFLDHSVKFSRIWFGQNMEVEVDAFLDDLGLRARV